MTAGLLPFAEWWGPVPNRSQGGMVRPLQGLVLHVIVGSLTAANTVFHDPKHKASAHFGVGKDGRLVQWVSINDKAWAEAAGNPHWLSVETEGQPTEDLTGAQIATLAKLYAWLHQAEGIPFTVANTVDEHGFGIHSMGGAAWGGHACPGVIRGARRQQILDLANPIPPPAPPAFQGADDMPTRVVADVKRNPAKPTSGYVLDAAGGVHPFGEAKAIAGGPYWKDVGAAQFIEILDWDAPSGWVIDCLGGWHAFGGAPDVSKGPNPPPYWKGGFIPPFPQT